MRIALDTSAYSAFMRGHPQIIDVVQRAEEVVLTTVVLGELLTGFRRGTRWQQNLSALERFQASARVQVATLDEETAHRYSEIATHLKKTGRPIPTNDIWIAASAMQLGLRVVTTDGHFGRVPQVVSEIFEPRPHS